MYAEGGGIGGDGGIGGGGRGMGGNGGIMLPQLPPGQRLVMLNGQTKARRRSVVG